MRSPSVNRAPRVFCSWLLGICVEGGARGDAVRLVFSVPILGGGNNGGLGVQGIKIRGSASVPGPSPPPAASRSAIGAYIRSLLPMYSDHMDILQEVNVTLWRKMEEFQAGTNFKAWAFATARYHVMSARRKLATEGEATDLQRGRHRAVGGDLSVSRRRLPPPTAEPPGRIPASSPSGSSSTA
jgi:hypothetical protein